MSSGSSRRSNLQTNALNPHPDPERCAQVIRVPETFIFQEGARITEDLVAGKLLGDGVQGQVYVLKRPNGESTDQLLKVREPSADRTP